MRMISGSMLNRLRSIHEDAMPDVVNIITHTYTSDSMGGFTSGSTSGSAICRISDKGSGSERQVAERLGVDSPYWLTFPYGTTIVEDDVVTIDSRTFEISAVNTGSYSTATRVLAREIK
jgi:hypothetical protein